MKLGGSKLTSVLLLVLSAALVLWVRLIPMETGGHAGEWTYTGEDGREHVYLGDFDSYLWLRHARTLLRTGEACDAVVDGECRDQHTNAPEGARSPYARTLHVSAIAAVHRLVTGWIAPDLPLPVSSFLTTVMVALAGVLPAFCIARMLGGTVAGPFAVVLIALDARVLARTIGSDNDVWSLTLPLYVLWFVLLGLQASSSAGRLSWAVAAGACVGLHAWAWRGWTFVHVIVTTALVCVLLLEAVLHLVKHGRSRVWAAPAVHGTALVLAAFWLAAGVATSVTPGGGYLQMMHDVAGAVLPGDGSAAAADLAWPNGLGAVAELAPLDLAAIARLAGGTAVLVGAFLGVVLLLLPRGGDGERNRVSRAAAVTLLVWFAAAAYAAHGGIRFYLFVVPPLGIACAVLVGRVTTAVRTAVAPAPRWYRAIATAGLWLVLALAFVRALDPGFAMALQYRPLMNDAWWNTLTQLRETTKPDAIVHTWWDHGHWVTYVADRRVSNDGSSLLTHIPYWTSRALLAANEVESAGVLRMLSCGSDASPLPEGEAGAYAIVRRTGRDAATAFATVADLIERDAAGAAAYLDAHGFTPSERDDVLRATHCAPPDAYLVLGTRLLGKRSALVASGAWDPRRPATPADDAAGKGDDASSPGVPFVARWIPCDGARAGGEVVCPIGLPIAGGRIRLDDVEYREDAPERALLTTSPGTGGPALTGAPAVVVLAGKGGFERVAPASPVHPDLGVLIDLQNRRVLVGAPVLLESTLVQLLYLDGRYSTRYAKVDQRESSDERVSTWRIRWPDGVAR